VVHDKYPYKDKLWCNNIKPKIKFIKQPESLIVIYCLGGFASLAMKSCEGAAAVLSVANLGCITLLSSSKNAKAEENTKSDAVPVERKTCQLVGFI
jgi:hypothetical protein